MDNDDNEELEGLRILGPDPTDSGEHSLPHWTEPGTGEVPILGSDDDLLEGLDANDFGTDEPSGDDRSVWATMDTDEPRWADDFEAEDELFGDEAADPIRIAAAEDDFFGFDGDEVADPDVGHAAAAPRMQSTGPSLGQPRGDRDLGQALLTAGLIAGIAIICFFLGKGPTLVLVAAALTFAALEFFVTLRRVGYEPATLLGLGAVAAMPLAAYWRFEAGIPVVLFLTMLFGAIWYLAGVNTERPVPNLGVTMLGIVYIGVLGSFAALMLRAEHGIGLLLCAVLVTVGYDVGAYFVGRAVGRSPLSDASPNKTIEGLFGGMVTSIAVALVVVGLLGEIEPFDGIRDAIVLGIVAAIVAPIGDLAESLMKRDLRIKDMGTILPGHGGVLDRFDALLFVLPATYYTARVLEII